MALAFRLLIFAGQNNDKDYPRRHNTQTDGDYSCNSNNAAKTNLQF